MHDEAKNGLLLTEPAHGWKKLRIERVRKKKKEYGGDEAFSSGLRRSVIESVCVSGVLWRFGCLITL